MPAPPQDTRAAVLRAAATGLFGGLFTIAISGVLLAFLALYESGVVGLIAVAVAFVIGFAIGFAYEWRRAAAGSPA